MAKRRTAATPPADQPDAATEKDQTAQVQPPEQVGTVPPVPDQTAATPPADQSDAATAAGPDAPTTPDEPNMDAGSDDLPPATEPPAHAPEPVANGCRHQIMRPGWAGKGKQRHPIYRCDSCGAEIPRGEDGRPTQYESIR